ncbi:MAG: 30S ribosomal protein S4, partial [Nitrospinaceae bacterium]|nr:30S ribosomal protein S4 [Nitrospinaceae bacterium]
MNHTGPKVKLSRRVGIPLTRSASKSMERRPGAPGMHRSRFGRKLSDYGRQLLEKQRLRYQYNITERKLRNYYLKASSHTGNTAEILIQMLETRLDAVVYRSGLAPTIYAARQLVSHGHILVDGQRVNIASYPVKPNQTITVKQKSQNMDLIKNSIQDAESVPYLAVDRDKMA